MNPSEYFPSRIFARATAITLVSITGITSGFATLPSGEQVVAGNASFNRDGTLMQITASDSSIINYHSFDIGAENTVQFIQPGADASVLNRVTAAANPSQILGTLTANGQVYLVNPAGISFGHNAMVDVGALFAAAGNISNEDFLAGANRFSGLEGAVTNLGSIEADGSVALLGSRVANFGSIVAGGDMVALASGGEIYLGERGGHLFVRVEQPATAGESGTGVENSGQIKAENGHAVLASGDMLGMSVLHSGIIESQTAQLEAEGSGEVHVDGGRIEASESVDLLGEKVGLFGETEIAAGDAQGGGDVRIGGDRQGLNPAVRNARAIHVGADATVSADAKISGSGGELIVFAEETAIVLGTLSARGAEGSNGGFVETSGLQHLVIAKNPLVGQGGEWLIDPNNIEIVAGGGNTNINDSDPFTTSTDGAQLGVDLIVNALTGGSNVLVLTGTNGTNSEDGNITLSTTLDFNGTGSNTLTFNAHNDIVIDGVITDSTPGVDQLNLKLIADSDSNGAGGISINQSINLGGGDLTAFGQSFTLNDNVSADTLDISNIATGSFLSVANLTGTNILTGSGNDTLTGTTGNDTFDITGADSGSVAGVSYTNVATLVGGAGDDTFDFADAGSVSGTISGGTDNDILDYADKTGAVAINLTDNSATSINGGAASGFSGIEVVTGNASDTTLTGTASSDTFGITGADDGSVAGVSYTDVTDLGGGAGNDTFDFADAGSVSGTVSGGADNDTLDYADVTGAVAVNLTDNSATSINGVAASGFSGIETVTGNASDTTLTGTAGADTFDITGADSGSVVGVSFTDVANLGGGAGDDTFDFADGATVSGKIDGGADNDILDYADETGAVAVSLADNSATSINGGGASGFSNIEGINGNGSGDTSVTGTAGADNFILGASNGDATSFGIQNLTVDGNGGSDTLTGTTGNDTFDIAGADSGSVAGVNYTGVANLAGGAGDDTFDFADAGSVSGTIDGGADSDTLDYADETGAVAVALSDNSATSISGGAASGFSGIEGVTGNATDTTLTGTAGADTFDITGADSGNVAGLTYTDVTDLAGGAGDDTFDFADAGSVSGTVSGGGDNDTLDYAAKTGTVAVSLTDNSATSINGGGSSGFIGIEGVTGNASDTTLTSTAGADTFDITGADSGNVAGLTYTDVTDLAGGAGADTFDFADAGSVSGTVSGGADNDTLDYADETGAVAIDFGNSSATSINGGVASGFSGFETIVGNSTDTALAGTAVADTIQIQAAGNGSMGSVDFSGVTRVDGRGGDDQFNVVGNYNLALELLGGADNDTLTFNSNDTLATTLSFNGNAGTNNVSFTQSFNTSADLSLTNIVNLAAATGATDGLSVGGVLRVAASGVINLASAGTFNAGSLDLSSTGGTITVNEDSAMVVDSIIAAADDTDDNTWSNVTLNAAGSISDSDTANDGTADIIGSTVNLTADTNGIGTSVNPLEVSVSSTTLNADTTGDNSDIFINGINDVIVGLVTAGSGDVTLDATGALDSASDDAVADVVGSIVNLTADAGGIGNSAVLDVAASTALNADTSADASDIVIDSIGDLVLGIFNSGAGSASVTGGGSSSVTGRNVASTWDFDGTPTYDDGINTVINLSGFSTYQGGTGSDAFNVTAATNADLAGGGGNDTFDFADAGSLSATVSGGAGDDTLDYADVTGAVAINLTDNSATSINGGAASGFSGIETVTGNASDTTLTGTAGADTFDITGADSGTVAGVNYADVTDLTGGAGDDTFDFADAGSVSGTVSGGTDNDTLDYADKTGAVAINLTDNSATSINGGAASGFNGIEVVTGNASDTILTGTAGSDTFDITGADSGSVAGVSYTDVTDLEGGAGDDTFDFADAGSVSGTVFGGADNDTLDYADKTGAVAIDLGNSSATSINGGGASGFSGIEVLAGNSTDSALAGTAVADTFQIQAAGNGSMGSVDFSGMTRVDGRGGDDQFNVVGNYNLALELLGGADNDTLTFNSTDTLATNLSFDGNGGTNNVSFTQSFNSNADLSLSNIASFTAATGATDGLSIGGALDIAATGAINLASAGTFNAGSLTFNSGDGVTIHEDASTQIAGTNMADSLDLDSAGAITDDATASISVTNNADLDGTSITLGDTGTDTLNAGSLTFNSGGAVTIAADAATEIVGTNTAGGIDLTGTDLAINGGIATTSGGTVTVNLSGAATIGAAGDIASDGAVSLTASGGITTAGDVATSDDDVTYASAVTLSGPVAVDTGADAGDINFQSTVDGAQDLNLTAGMGDVTFAGLVGDTDPLGHVVLASANNVSVNGMRAESFAQLNGEETGTTTFNNGTFTDTEEVALRTSGEIAANPGVGIDVVTEGGILVDGLLKTAAGTGGEVLVSPEATVNVTPVAGQHDIRLNGDDVVALAPVDLSFVEIGLVYDFFEMVRNESMETRVFGWELNIPEAMQKLLRDLEQRMKQQLLDAASFTTAAR